MADHRNGRPTYDSLGLKGELVTKSDTEDISDTAKAIRADAAGTLVILPWGNVDGEEFPITVQAGEVPPWVVRRVFATGSDNIAVHTVDD